MIFNVHNPKAQARTQATIVRRQLLLERQFRKRVHTLLKQQFRTAADHVRQGSVNVDRIVNSTHGQMTRIFQEEYARVGGQFFGLVEKGQAVMKAADAPLEQKGMKDVFWNMFFNWVRVQTAKKVTYVQETTKQMLRETIEAGKADGMSYGEIADDIWDSTGDDFTFKRAVRIARTEVHAASSFATQAAVRSTGLPGLVREWIAMADERVRSDHRHAHGQTRGMDEPFDVGGEELMFPGDPNGSAANVINCR